MSSASAQHGHPTGGPTGKLTVGVGSPQAAPNQEVDIPITLAGAANLGALELVLTYDPAILEAKSAERDKLLGSNSLVEYYNNPTGRLAVTLVSQDNVTGDGPVVKTRFLVKGQSGQKCALRLENVRAWDGKTHLDVLVTTTPGEFTVASPWPWWLIPVVIGLTLLLFLGLLVIVRRARPTPAAAPLPCPNCGKPLEPGAAFCSHCGHKIVVS